MTRPSPRVVSVGYQRPWVMFWILVKLLVEGSKAADWSAACTGLMVIVVDCVLHCPRTFTWPIDPGVVMQTNLNKRRATRPSRTNFFRVIELPFSGSRVAQTYCTFSWGGK